MTDVRIVLITIPDDDAVLEQVARPLVEERLAACVNVLPGVRSFYRWEGEVQDDAERLLIVKTTADRLPALTARVAELHPYTVPEVVAAPVLGGFGPYLQWVREQTRP
jgi:periplasmic divalent cation tolerance protein